jgi:hypothetical protein
MSYGFLWPSLNLHGGFPIATIAAG